MSKFFVRPRTRYIASEVLIHVTAEARFSRLLFVLIGLLLETLNEHIEVDDGLRFEQRLP